MNDELDPNKPPQQNQSSDFRIVIAQRLGLTPAEGETEITDEAIIAKLDEVIAAAGSIAGLNEQLTTGQTALEKANADLEALRGEYQTLIDREEEARKQKNEAEVDVILENYADRFASPEAMAPVRDLLLSNRESGMALLNGLAKPGPAKAEELPPPDQHDPNANADEQNAPNEEQIAAAIKARAQQIQSADKSLPWSSAWAQAEREVRAKVKENGSLT